MPRQKSGERVLGPYKHPDGCTLVTFDAENIRTTRLYPTRAEALEAKAEIDGKVGERAQKTVGEAIEEYEIYMREKGNKTKSITETVRRLKAFFPDSDTTTLRTLSPKVCVGLYEEQIKRPTRSGEPAAVDSHRNYLMHSKTFLGWCVEQKYFSSNPLEGVKGKGKRKRGKPQLRIDEARKWLTTALALADEGKEGAVAAVATLLMGVRCSELTDRIVRDVDDGGRLLWIPNSKTEAGRRTLEIPAVLQPHFLRLTEGRKANDLLFGYHRRDWPREWVQRICGLVGVPTVCAHAMRGAHATLATEHGATGHIVAAALGHADVSTTMRNYAQRDRVEGAKSRRALQVLAGGLR